MRLTQEQREFVAKAVTPYMLPDGTIVVPVAYEECCRKKPPQQYDEAGFLRWDWRPDR
jgi:hypothetical protein